MATEGAAAWADAPQEGVVRELEAKLHEVSRERDALEKDVEALW